MAVTIESDTPTCPTVRPHMPKPNAPGIRFGTMLVIPSRHDRNAKMRMKEIPTRASVVPTSMEIIFRRPRLANINVVPALTAPEIFGAWPASHCCAR